MNEAERNAFEQATCALILRDHPECGLTVDEIRSQRDGDTYKTSSWAFGWWAWCEGQKGVKWPTPNKDAARHEVTIS